MNLLKNYGNKNIMAIKHKYLIIRKNLAIENKIIIFWIKYQEFILSTDCIWTEAEF